MTRRQISGVSSQVGALPPARPALLIRMSMRPWSATACRVASRTAFSRLSSTMAVDTLPREFSVSRASASCAVSMSHNTTRELDCNMRRAAPRCGQANALGAAGDDGDAAIQVYLIHLDSPFNV